MTIEEEDKTLREAHAIRSRLFDEAQEKWKVLSDAEKKRPWPRCTNVTCNRTLVCVGTRDEGCQGFDY